MSKIAITYPVFLCVTYPKELLWMELLTATRATEVFECRHKIKVNDGIRILTGKTLCGFYLKQTRNPNNTSVKFVEEHDFRNAFKRVFNKIHSFL